MEPKSSRTAEWKSPQEIDFIFKEKIEIFVGKKLVFVEVFISQSSRPNLLFNAQPNESTSPFAKKIIF